MRQSNRRKNESRQIGNGLHYQGRNNMKIIKYKKFSPGEFRAIIEEMVYIHEKKNHDYSGGDYLSDLIASRRMGITPWKNALLRMQQKMGRMESFAKQGEFKVSDEKFEDSCKDLAVYSLLMLMLYKYKK